MKKRIEVAATARAINMPRQIYIVEPSRKSRVVPAYQTLLALAECKIQLPFIRPTVFRFCLTEIEVHLQRLSDAFRGLQIQ